MYYLAYFVYTLLQIYKARPVLDFYRLEKLITWCINDRALDFLSL